MEILYLLIPLSLVFFAFACWAFFWSVKHRQFDDMDTAAKQILEQDEQMEPKPVDSKVADSKLVEVEKK